MDKKNVTFKMDDVQELAQHEFADKHVVELEDKNLENEVFVDRQSEVNDLTINLEDTSDNDHSDLYYDSD